MMYVLSQEEYDTLKAGSKEALEKAKADFEQRVIEYQRKIVDALKAHFGPRVVEAGMYTPESEAIKRLLSAIKP